MTTISTPAVSPVLLLFGIPVSGMTMDQVLVACDEAVEKRELLSIGVINAAKVVKMRRDEQLFRAVTSCDLIVADGQAVVWASRILRRPLPERVAGVDLFENLLARAADRGHRVFVLGATDAVLSAALVVAQRRWPALVIAGSRNGYFDDDEAASIAKLIHDSNADILFVGMTSPKKELFLDAWSDVLGVSVCHGVGGSIDVMAGKVRRAPVLWQRLGLEWLYRVVQEPRRLWRRYLVTNIAFTGLVAKEMVHATPARTHHESAFSRTGSHG